MEISLKPKLEIRTKCNKIIIEQFRISHLIQENENEKCVEINMQHKPETASFNLL